MAHEGLKASEEQKRAEESWLCIVSPACPHLGSLQELLGVAPAVLRTVSTLFFPFSFLLVSRGWSLKLKQGSNVGAAPLVKRGLGARFKKRSVWDPSAQEVAS